MKETRQAYELLLSLNNSQMEGAIPPEVLNGAAFGALTTLKVDSLKDVDRKRDVEGALGVKRCQRV
ncbi:hypothetical protein HDU81_004556 [Chytriomyces hyalinus]|nr:hypothetical protein HDU81_004556 [Chytriomyces hyalinus]